MHRPKSRYNHDMNRDFDKKRLRFITNDMGEGSEMFEHKVNTACEEIEDKGFVLSLKIFEGSPLKAAIVYALYDGRNKDYSHRR